MADTSQQLMIEMNRQLEELRLQQTKQAEEQSAWNQELKEELKDVLREIFGTELSNLRQQSARNQEHEEKLKYDELICQEEEPSQVVVQNEPNLAKVPSDFTAHQVLDEMPESQNCIEHEPCVELSNYNGQGVFEMAGGIKGGAEPPTYTDEVQTNDHDRSTEEVLEIDGDLSQDLVARHVLEEMSQSTKTIEVIGVLTKDDDDDDLLEMASWIEEDCEPPTYAKGYMRLMCFDPGGEEHKNLKVFECAVDADTVVTSADAERGEENGVHSDEAYEGDETIEDEMVNGKLDLLHISDANTSSMVFDFLTWEIFVGFVPRIGQGAKNYCDETLIFDPGGLIVINNFSFLAASGEPSFGHTNDVGELELSLEDFSYVGSDSHGAGVVVFDPGGDEVKMLQRHFLGTSTKIRVGANRAQVASSFLQRHGCIEPCLMSSFEELSRGEKVESLCDSHEVGLVILDDGMQHLSLMRDVEIVMVNGLMQWGNHIFDPGGKWFLHSELMETLARLIFDPGGQCYKNQLFV